MTAIFTKTKNITGVSSHKQASEGASFDKDGCQLSKLSASLGFFFWAYALRTFEQIFELTSLMNFFKRKELTYRSYRHGEESTDITEKKANTVQNSGTALIRRSHNLTTICTKCYTPMQVTYKQINKRVVHLNLKKKPYIIAPSWPGSCN